MIASARHSLRFARIGVLALAPALLPAQFTVDGELGSDPYGPPLAVQANTTGFGDNLNPDPLEATAGSELDGLYAKINGDDLYLLVTGNLETNFNKLNLFIDSRPGGQNTLRADNPNIVFNELNNQAGLTFDTSFEADYFLQMGGGDLGDGITFFLNYAELYVDEANPGSGLELGETGAENTTFPVTLTSDVQVGINNSNIAGVTDSEINNPATVTTGFELRIPLALLGHPTGAIQVCAFISNPNGDFLSNQVLGSLPNGTSNLGSPAGIDFNTFAGEQFVSILPTGITLDGSASFQPLSTFNAASFDARGSDKLVVVASGEHNFNATASGQIYSISYDGVPLTKAVDVDPKLQSEGGHGDTATDIWYLDNPGVVHSAGALNATVEGTGNNYVFTVLGLSGTRSGVGAVAAAAGAASVDLTTTEPYSTVLFNLGMGGGGNTADDTTTPDSPADAVKIDGVLAGFNYASHNVAQALIATPGPFTFSFDTSKTDVATIAVEFLASKRSLVSTTADTGPGSLREAIASALPGDILLFDFALDGTTLALSTPLLIDKDLTIDASALPRGLTLSGGDSTRIMEIPAGQVVKLRGLTFADGFVTGNGGALLNAGNLTVSQCVFWGNEATVNGGAIEAPVGSTTTIEGSTFYDNTATGAGGAIAHAGILAVSNSTFTTNATAGLGGAIFNFDSSLTVANVTVTGNEADVGGGISLFTTGAPISLQLNNSIVAGNTATSFDDEVNGPLTPSSSDNFIGGAPVLAPLGDYGGPTPTMPPLPGSLAIDGGGITALSTDQRGFPRVIGGSVDLGAVETGNAIPGFDVITRLDDSINGANDGVALREAILFADPAKNLIFDPALDGQTLSLTDGQIVLDRDLTIDGTPLKTGITISSNRLFRHFEVTSGATVTLNRLTLAEGKADFGGSILNGGTLTVVNTTFKNNEATLNGGAINTSAGSTTTINASTFAENHAVDGGAVAHAGTTVILNSTFTANTANGLGGAVFNFSATLSLEHATLTANTAGAEGGGLHLFNNGPTPVFNLSNSIIADNSSPVGPDIQSQGATITPDGVNLLSALTGSGLVAGPTIIEGSPAPFAPLGDYGGPTETLLPRPGSLAINAGGTTPLTTDQRGLPRAVGTVDIGAVETGHLLPGLIDPVVTSENDAVDGLRTNGISLREAIEFGAAGSTLTFDPDLDGATIALWAGQLRIDKDLTIDASALAAGLNLTGNSNGDAVFQIGETRHFAIDAGATVTLKGLTLVDGFSDFGGSIRNEGTLTVVNSTLTNGVATVLGGAIFNLGTLTLTDSTLSGNSAENGAGILNASGGTLILNNSTLSANSATSEGGGIYNSGTVTLTGSTLTGNSALDGGGGISNQNNLTISLSTLSQNVANQNGGAIANARDLTIEQSTFANNVATQNGGAIANASDLTIEQSTFTGNTANLNGGAIYANDDFTTVKTSTFVGNQAIDGGAIAHGSALTVENSTFTANTATGLGGAIFNISSLLTVTHATLTQNTAATGGGIALNQSGGPGLRMNASVVANNNALVGPDLAKTSDTSSIIVSGVNLLSDLAGSGLTSGPTVLVGDPRLAPLGDYGGPTQTMPPLPGSPVIDPAGGDTSSTLATDQRGLARVVGSYVDIGAVESGNDTPGFNVVTSLDDELTGAADGVSLREAIEFAPAGSTLDFDQDLSGETLTLTNGPLLITRDLEIDASDLLEGFNISGSNLFRVMEIAGNPVVSLIGLTIRDGAAGDGAGILLRNEAHLILKRCLLTSNQANLGAINAVGNRTALSLIDSTVSGNGMSGGVVSGIRCQSATLLITRSTIAQNGTGAAVRAFGVGANVTLHDSLIAGNAGLDLNAEGFSSNPDALVTSLGGNLIGDETGFIGTPLPSDQLGSAAHPLDPLLAPLGDYGGPTQTMPPLPGSPAIDAGGSVDPGGPDQRGFARLSGPALDIGAVELQEILVNTVADENDGIDTSDVSLRDAIDHSVPGEAEVIRFDPAVFDGEPTDTINLTNGQLVADRMVLIDASELPEGISISGGGVSRVMEVTGDNTIEMGGLTILEGRDDEGAGILLSMGADLTMVRCLVTDNRGNFGAINAVGNTTRLQLINSTVAGNNKGSGAVAGIRAYGATVSIIHSTISDNSTGSAVRAFGSGTHITLANSIIAGNTGSDLNALGFSSFPDALVISLGGNLIGDSTGFLGTPDLSDQLGSAAFPLDPLLAPLGDYGGPTQTMPPLPGSPAIEGGILTVDTPLTDQIGNPRPSGLFPDIGAVEALPLGALGLVSADGDTIPDILEGPGTPYPHLSPTADDSALDTDGDGSRDGEELANMTDLFDGTDYFRVVAYRLADAWGPLSDPTTDPVVTITLSTFPGLSYGIEAGSTLLEGDYLEIPSAAFTADAFEATLDLILPPGSEFIRAKRED
jgi:predicted outer membrane repeat protein